MTLQYQISTSPVSAIIQTLVQLVINTVEAQHHRCRKTDDSFLVPTPTVHRSKGKGTYCVMLFLYCVMLFLYFAYFPLKMRPWDLLL